MYFFNTNTSLISNGRDKNTKVKKGMPLIAVKKKERKW